MIAATDTRDPIAARVARPAPRAIPAGECVAAVCDECGRLMPRADAIFYRREGTWRREDGADCDAATRAAGRGGAS